MLSLTLCPLPVSFCFLLQFNVRETHLWDCEPVSPPVPGQLVCLLPDSGTCMFCNGVHSRRRPDDAHPHWRLHGDAGCVRHAGISNYWLITSRNPAWDSSRTIKAKLRFHSCMKTSWDYYGRMQIQTFVILPAKGRRPHLFSFGLISAFTRPA